MVADIWDENGETDTVGESVPEGNQFDAERGQAFDGSGTVAIPKKPD